MSIEEYLARYGSNLDVFCNWIQEHKYSVSDALLVLQGYAAKSQDFPSNYAMNQCVLADLRDKKWEGVKELVATLNSNINPQPVKDGLWSKVKRIANKKVW